MRRRVLLAAVTAAFCIGLPALASEIAQTDATIVLVPDTSGRFTAAQVTETVTPPPGPRDKALRFGQLLTPWQIERPIVVGSDGQPLPVEYAADQLSWSLPASEAGPVTIRFWASPVVQETRLGNRLRLDWLTRWDGPIIGHTATILFPQGFIPQDVTSSWDAVPAARPVSRVAQGVQALQVDIARAPAEPLVVAFTPKLVSVATTLYALLGALLLLAIQTGLRLSRVPHLFRRDPRDPTPTEFALLCNNEIEAVLVAHLDLELQQGLLRGGQDFETVHAEVSHEPYQQFILAYYQVPRALTEFFRRDCVHYRAAVDGIRDALHRKGLLRDLSVRRRCGWDLFGFWAVAVTFIGLIVYAVQPWGQAWTGPWLIGGGAVLIAYLVLPLYFLLQDPITPLADAKILKYETLLQEGLHTRDETRGYRLQLTYGAAYKGVDWLEGALPEEQLAVYRSVLRPPEFVAQTTLRPEPGSLGR